MKKNDRNILKNGFKNVKYVLLAQIIGYALSFITGIILPNFLGVKEFAYWQIYVFYFGYIGFIQFGFNDGIYLRYGGYEYEDLPKKKFRSFIRILFISQVILSIITIVTILYLEKDINKCIAYIAVSLNFFIWGTNAIFIMINQVTNRIKKYSIGVCLDKIQMLIFIILLITLNKKEFQYYIIADILTRITVLIYNVVNCRDLVFGKSEKLKNVFNECVLNIKIGISLMFANIMASLLIGIGRMLIERFNSIEEFGMYSFSISLTNIMLMFINASSLVVYPMLCRVSKDRLPNYYKVMTRVINIFLFILLLIYYPMVWIVKNIMIEYIPILEYLYLLIPMILVQAKMQMIVNTYYKSLREEKKLLKANLSSVIFFCILGIPSFILTKSVKVIVICTVITLFIRYYSSDMLLKKKMGIYEKKYKDTWFEIIIVAIFIISTGTIGGLSGFIIYIAALSIYIYVNRKIILKDTKGIWEIITCK